MMLTNLEDGPYEYLKVVYAGLGQILADRGDVRNELRNLRGLLSDVIGQGDVWTDLAQLRAEYARLTEEILCPDTTAAEKAGVHFD